MSKPDDGNAGATIPVERELLEGALHALNEIRNTPLRVGRWTSTYALASELSRVLGHLRELPGDAR